jgi:DNA-binding IclR family transcriptional regulator
VSSSDRVVRLLEQVVSAPEPLTHAELAAAAELPRSTAFNLLGDLRRLGYVDVVDRRYVAGNRLIALSYQITQKSQLRQRLRPELEAIAAETGETVLLMVETGGSPTRAGELFLVDQVQSTHPLRYVAEFPGSRPIYPAASGKVLLAFSGRTADSLPEDVFVRWTPKTVVDRAAIDAELTQIRKRGYAATADERTLGMSSIAGPVRDPTGAVVAAISIVGPSVRVRNGSRLWPTLRAALERASGRADDESAAV